MIPLCNYDIDNIIFGARFAAITEGPLASFGMGCVFFIGKVRLEKEEAGIPSCSCCRAAVHEA